MLKVKHRKNSVMRYISDVYKNKVNSFVYIYIVFITYCFKGSSLYLQCMQMIRMNTIAFELKDSSFQFLSTKLFTLKSISN